MTVVNFLKHGRENAIRADVLAAAMGTTPRGLRRLIMQARECGEVVLYQPGGRGGYFLHMQGRQLCRKRSLSAAFRSRWQTCATSCELSKHSMKFLPQTLGFASKG